MPLEQLLTARQLAEALAVPVPTVLGWRQRRGVPALRVGGAVRYRLAEVEAWLARDRAAPAQDDASPVEERPAEAVATAPARREVRPRPVVTDLPDESRRPVLVRCAECGLRVPPRLPCIPCATRAGRGAQARAAHEQHFARAS